jgi:hypothetical protein
MRAHTKKSFLRISLLEMREEKKEKWTMDEQKMLCARGMFGLIN